MLKLYQHEWTLFDNKCKEHIISEYHVNFNFMMPDVGIVNGGGFYSKTKDRDMYYKKIGDKFMQYRLYPNFYQAK